jgi:hypothetical protein
VVVQAVADEGNPWIRWLPPVARRRRAVGYPGPNRGSPRPTKHVIFAQVTELRGTLELHQQLVLGVVAARALGELGPRPGAGEFLDQKRRYRAGLSTTPRAPSESIARARSSSSCATSSHICEYWRARCATTVAR